MPAACVHRKAWNGEFPESHDQPTTCSDALMARAVLLVPPRVPKSVMRPRTRWMNAWFGDRFLFNGDAPTTVPAALIAYP